MSPLKELETFVDYTLSFYNNRDGLYPLGFSDDTIIRECVEYYAKCHDFCGDTVDRENIRVRLTGE